jgi:peptidoglycan/xylan/chitin deacetylase (PgdA/CDA1 family)
MEKPSADHVAITFDDGYAHLADTLPKLMKAYQFRPTIFMPTGYIGRSNDWDYSHMIQKVPHMDEEQIRRLSVEGAQFGSHGHAHRDLTGLDSDSLKKELKMSREILESLTGSEVATISYPFGRWNEAVLNATRDAGYRYGFTMSFPQPNDTALAAGRYGIHGFDTQLAVLSKLNHGVLYPVEHVKAAFTSKLSGGTVLLDRLRGRGGRKSPQPRSG